MDRGERIHRKRRNLERWRRIVSGWFRDEPNPMTDPAAERLAYKAAAHGKLCSCYACGNKRGTEGPTIQERRHTDSGEAKP